MPRSQRTVTYGAEYEQLLLRAHGMPNSSYHLEFASPTQARSLQAKVYAYFKALRKESQRPDLIQMSDDLAMRVEGCKLHFFRKEDSWDAIAIRKALGLEKGFAELGGVQVAVSPAAKDAMIDKLADLRKGKK